MRTALNFQPTINLPTKQAVKTGDPFLESLDDALAQVDPRICTDVRWLASLGLMVEAERLLIDYLVTDTRSYEIKAEREAIAKVFRADNMIMSLWVCRIVDWNVIGTFIACLSWVFIG